MFGQNGQHLRAFGSEQLKRPVAVFCNEYGNILVADSTEERVVLFNGLGELVSSFTTTVEKLSAVCMDDNKHILVSGSAKTVQVFNRRCVGFGAAHGSFQRARSSC